ncbi:MAG TPA: GTPase Era [Gammaproteobacteria bacterium]|nr:GTPase Era [Gammaproteobacteria bacterium]
MAERFGFFAVVGRPNVGKSSLVNRLIGEKVSITSRRPQTTRNRILGIRTQGMTQIVFVDTPGMQAGQQGLDYSINETAKSSARSADIIGMMVDARGWHDKDDQVLDYIRHLELPTYLLINKTDLLHSAALVLPLIASVSRKHSFTEILPVSVKRGHNLSRLLSLVEKQLPEGPFGFPIEQVRVSQREFIIGEFIREQIFHAVGLEVPYSIAVDVTGGRKTQGDGEVFSAEVWVESKGQKAIVLGPGGSRLKTIGSKARRELSKAFGLPVSLDIWIKIRKGWTNHSQSLEKLGYGPEQ